MPVKIFAFERKFGKVNPDFFRLTKFDGGPAKFHGGICGGLRGGLTEKEPGEQKKSSPGFLVESCLRLIKTMSV